MSDLPLLGFSPPHGVHPSETGRGSPLSTVELREQQAVACLPPVALHGLPITRADPLSRVDLPIPRFLACTRLPRLAWHQMRAYRPCDLSPRSAVPRHRDPCEPLSIYVTRLPEPREPIASANCLGRLVPPFICDPVRLREQVPTPRQAHLLPKLRW
jgi:hypothetical protein